MTKLIIPSNKVIPCPMDIPIYGELSEIIGANTIHTDVIVDPGDYCIIQMCEVDTNVRSWPAKLYLKHTDNGIKSLLILSKGYDTPETRYADNFVFYNKE